MGIERMRDIAKEAVNEFWEFVQNKRLTVVDSNDDFAVYLEHSDIRRFCDLYVKDFEQRKRATICPDGSIYIKVLAELLDGYGLTYERIKELAPKGFEFG